MRVAVVMNDLLLIWTLVPFLKLCLHSLFWNAQLQTETLASVYSTWCILTLGVKQFHRIWDQSSSCSSPRHCDTVTYWLLMRGLVFLSGGCPYLSHQTIQRFRGDFSSYLPDSFYDKASKYFLCTSIIYYKYFKMVPFISNRQYVLQGENCVFFCLPQSLSLWLV